MLLVGQSGALDGPKMERSGGCGSTELLSLRLAGGKAGRAGSMVAAAAPDPALAQPW